MIITMNNEEPGMYHCVRTLSERACIVHVYTVNISTVKIHTFSFNLSIFTTELGEQCRNDTFSTSPKSRHYQ